MNDRTDTSFFGDNFLQTTAVLGAFEALRELREKRFGDRLFLVSKCGPKIEERTLDWLAHHKFASRTSIDITRVWFCRKRQDKAKICRDLGISHFVDDRLEVLSYLPHVPVRFLFRPRPEEVREFARFLSQVRQVETWEEILQAILH